MSKIYCERFGIQSISKTDPGMRDYCRRPGRKNEDGTPQYFTEQSHKDECDVNKIIRKYDKNGIITHVSRFEAQFGDLTGDDFKTMTDTIVNAQAQFDKLPSKIRNRFQNDPAALLRFMEDPSNRDEAIELGLINKAWTPETDGLGEHVKMGENKTKEPGSDATE